MCGISFVLDPLGATDVARTVSRLHEPIRHRGPDAERFLFLEAGGALSTPDRPFAATKCIAAAGFRRLKIVDLSDDAMQPMIAADRSAALLFNGEIYNFRALRSELESRGHDFRTAGDTEVVLAAYREWGKGCFARLEGMWAIVIVDFARRRVVGSRDRFGIKPLHWARLDGALLLASEARQIVHVMDCAPSANEERVAAHIRGNRFPVTDETFFRDVHCLPPASFFEVSFDDTSDPVFQEYWRLADVEVDHALRYDAAVDRFEAIFDAAVRSHHVADVAIGSLLSGGLDSAMVTSALTAVGREENRRFPAFSFGFRDRYREYSELDYVDAIARSERLIAHETSFDDRWVAANISRVIASIEEPPLALPVAAQFRTFELCREHGITVVLDGQGADEILAGYPYHQRTATTAMLRRGRFGAFVREMNAIARRGGTSTLAKASEFYLQPLLRRARRAPSIVKPDFGRRSPERLDASRDPSPLNRRLYADVRWGNVKIILQYADRNAMAHSLEARVPFFDRTLVEFAFSLPDFFKAGEGDRKRIQRDVARRRLPPAITERGDRMGFATPDVPMILGPLRDFVRERVTDRAFATHPFFDRAGYEDLLRRFDAGDASTVRPVWRLFTLALWKDAFGVVFS